MHSERGGSPCMESLILLLFTVVVLLFISGPAALVWCFSLKRDNDRLRAELVHLSEHVRSVAMPGTQRAPAADAPASATEDDLAARRESAREALRTIHGAAPPPAADAAAPDVAPAASGVTSASAPPSAATSEVAAASAVAAPSDVASAPPPPPFVPPSPAPGLGAPEPARPGLEQWIGVRGAAALGAIVLVIAGLYFFRYSIEKGLITPALRVALGTLLGTGCLVLSETTLRRRFQPLSHWIAGAGIALLYLSFWAAAALYGLVSVPLASVLMILVTATSCLLAVKRRSVAVALLGLVGGFATPLLLSTGSDRPVALFAYLLVLDVALLSVARHRRWPALALFSLLGTALYQALWIGGRMEADRLGLGIGILLVFAGLFAFATRRRDEEESVVLRLTRLATLLLPFLFALYFGLNAELSQHFLLPGAYLGLIVLGAAWYPAPSEARAVGLGAVAAALGALCAWLATHAPTLATAWEVMGVVSVLAVALLGLAEREAEKGSPLALVWTLGALAATAIWAVASPAIAAWPWLVGFSSLSLLALRLSARQKREGFATVSLAALGAAVGLLTATHAAEPGFTTPPLMLFSVLGLGAGVCAVVLLRSTDRGRRFTAHGAALSIALMLVGYGSTSSELGLRPTELFAGTLLLGLLICIASLRSRTSLWFLSAVLGTALIQTRFAWQLDAAPAALRSSVLGLQVLSVFAFGGWALLLPKELKNTGTTWRTAALIGPAFFFPLRHLYVGLLGDAAIAIVPISLAVFSLLLSLAVSHAGPTESKVRRTARVWLGAATLAFVTAAIPLQLKNEWVTIAWALQGALTLALWRRIDHLGLKYFSLALLGAATLRLIANPAVLEYHARGPVPVFGWLSYTYLVPALAMLGAWWLVRDLEVVRLREAERFIPGRMQPLVARLAVTFAIAIGFVWLNLTIIDLFATGPTLRVALEHRPARDLTLSVAWAVYALALLALGVWRANLGLRALSLALLLVTCAKVFLYDLSHLADLYRVASLVGLAFSLIVVSLSYQRFVFRNRDWGLHAT